MRMKLLLGSFLISLSALQAATQALEPGKNYDFFQKNGQNVLGAELMEESASQYQVRLKYLPKPILISKENLAKPPALSKAQEVKPGKKSFYSDFIVHASGGYSYLSMGPLSSIFPSGFQAGGGVDWLFMREPFYRLQSLSSYAGFTLYQNTPRKIQLVSILAGPKFLLWKIPAIDAAVFGSALAGMSFANLTGYTFTSSYATFSAMGILHFEKRVKMFVVGLQLYVNYLGDNNITFASTGVGVSVLYPIGGARPF